MAHPYLTGATQPKIFAHRGFVPLEARDTFVENTREAFRAAVAAGAEYVETDVHLTQDGVVVCFHDADLVRVAGDPRPVASLTRAELAAVMTDKGGLVTLEDALAEFPGTRFNIDVKAVAAAEQTGWIVAGAADRVLLTSFSDRARTRALAAARERGALPATSLGKRGIMTLLAALATRSEWAIDRALARVDALQIPLKSGLVPVLTERLVRHAHRNGVEVHVWTVNNPLDMRVLMKFGVDGVVTDRTDLAVAELR
ncbi:glycerophosphodiester phosphodiesterase [Leucobacter sp. cx-328]|uniref:glycerophosphodiester phosphodiesterase family protein n=1 Tax=unclassified Leucobacter TaxID=2621730 RepID=UPI00165DA72A|nr:MULTISPECIES: glycerophosphodiester phosphodiesterase family protein [unclassified Leucobacter]MBC9944147.1 glycerophosphodiester phosphodiesterase [Leucobacter sp. cx-328]